MSALIDEKERERFATGLQRNFSVVASAGSGKTHAITARIVALARHERAIEWLPALLVVTYTNRAAAEMQQRARQSIIEADVSPEVLAAFNRAFFGTIHSLCMRLLRQHGHYLGLPGQLDHLDEGNDAALWREFLHANGVLRGALDETQRTTLLRLASAQKLMELGRNGGAFASTPSPGPFPDFDFSEIHAFTPDKRSQATVARCRAALRRWEMSFAAGEFAGPIPACESKPLRAIWDPAVAPLRAWLHGAAIHVAGETARTYREFRLQRGAMTYGDQVALAAELLRHPEAARRIRVKNHRVILDEAQDTDPVQFEVLLEIARPPEAAGTWLEARSDPPRPGHFCMVGDFQQSIYGSRADLPHYRRIHDALAEGAGEALEFSVTFRLDKAGLGWINAAFPALLDGHDEQVNFVELNPRPAALPGQVARLDLGDTAEVADCKDWEKARWEAQRLAGWLKAQGLEKLRAESWSEVALLCPRTRWLPVLRAALQSVGLKAQVQSERAINGDSAAFAWFTSLVAVLAAPRDGYEIVGVLREVFGISDQALADFSHGDGGRFQIGAPTPGKGSVEDTLNLLFTLRERVAGWPLFSAMKEMAGATQLRERLSILPESDSEDFAEELDSLLTRAAAAEAEGATIATFAEELRTAFTAKREVRATVGDAVQIISGHKAKGSEWDAVIVPFFARRVRAGQPVYPRLVREPGSRKFRAAFDGDDLEDLKEAIDAQFRHEMERVLYVALTRARHTLVLVDDRALFSGKSGLQKNAQAKLLCCDAGGKHAQIFDALTESLSPCKLTRTAQEEKSASRKQAQSVVPLAPTTGAAVTTARKRAANFIKRNPSALAEAALAEADPVAAPAGAQSRATAQNSGQLYGTWWHGFVERIDWSARPSAWDDAFSESLPDSPDAARSRHEWALLRAELTRDSELARVLMKPGVIAHVEMPFLWAMSGTECIEGIMDLAIFDPASERWTIVDWKTNRIAADKTGELRAHYLPQLCAYWKAAGALFGAPVATALYSTATGVWLPYDERSLASEWERIKGAPHALAAALAEE